MLYGNVPIYQTRYKRHFFLWSRFSETNGGRERSEFVCVKNWVISHFFSYIFTFRLVLLTPKLGTCTYNAKYIWNEKLRNVTTIWMLSVKDGLSYHVYFSIYATFMLFELFFCVTNTVTCDLNVKIIAPDRGGDGWLIVPWGYEKFLIGPIFSLIDLEMGHSKNKTSRYSKFIANFDYIFGYITIETRHKLWHASSIKYSQKTTTILFSDHFHINTHTNTHINRYHSTFCQK